MKSTFEICKNEYQETDYRFFEFHSRLHNAHKRNLNSSMTTNLTINLVDSYTERYPITINGRD